ncbi:MAG: preprotein translocase subunit SecG [Deltaproteobacteria bacterium]|nr:preprotein translocase subunit SecG [Deltaproteobacteria bacterium]MBW1719016.1 preprotein translocase subunit SecG [Deltaproteobacteria bacterium]MBW1932437.1 preprotein translocase subunit SecG [Deltaproteobacteria bacterium]MBW1937780.1 preprotein translocase subunit SecG [Deltaproteobacteria bacterium]MBW1963915.1 preprotein translocase subunit SecG [Deltaproteobacteria bacterium]
MYSILIVVYVIVCILLVLTVLLQQGKGAEIGAVFGSSDTIFGSAGPASFLHKITSGLAVFFMVFALILTYLSAHRVEDSIMQDVEVTTSPVATKPGEIPEATETIETTETLIPKTVKTAPAPVTEVEKPVQGPDEKTNTLAEDSQPKEE